MANLDLQRGMSGPLGAVLAPAFGGDQPSIHRDLQGVVSRALSSARASGRDYLGQTDAAARAVMAVRPDFSLSQATRAVDWVRDHP